jgi:hypothetical protein
MVVNDLNISFRDDFFKDKELFEYLGRSLYECQRLEVTLAFIIQELHVLKGEIKSKNILEYLREIQEILDKRLNHYTLGRLFGEFNEFLPELDEESNKLFESALAKRNYIAHKFFFKNSIAMISPNGPSIVKDDLKQSIEIISSAYKLSEKMLLDIRKRIKCNT